jgi:hypothetical protein
MSDIDDMEEQYEKITDEVDSLYEELKSIYRDWSVSDLEELAAKSDDLVKDASKAKALEDAMVALEEQRDTLGEMIKGLSAS